MTLPIVIYGSQILRNASVEIGADYDGLSQLIDDMRETMAVCEGVGLAAPQIGRNIKLFVVDCSPWGEEHEELMNYRKVFINAQILERSEETGLFEEGCLSLPNLHEKVRRPESIKMRWMDENFEQHEEWIEGLPARVIQHEYDHIEGKVFTDHLTPLKRNLLKSKFQNFIKGKYRCSYKTSTK